MRPQDVIKFCNKIFRGFRSKILVFPSTLLIIVTTVPRCDRM